MEYLGLAVGLPILLAILLLVVLVIRRRNISKRYRKNFANSEVLDKVLVSQFRTEHSEHRSDRRQYR